MQTARSILQIVPVRLESPETAPANTIPSLLVTGMGFVTSGEHSLESIKAGDQLLRPQLVSHTGYTIVTPSTEGYSGEGDGCGIPTNSGFNLAAFAGNIKDTMMGNG